jgi:S-formylglutathione hydrolase FrmB
MSRGLVNGASVLLGLALTVPAGATASRMSDACTCACTGYGAAAPPSASPLPSSATAGSPADDGARIVRVVTTGDRTRDLIIASPVAGTVPVRLLLPRTFDAQGADRYPALYLLHGGGGEYTDWTQQTGVEAVTAPTNLLVVMPAAASSRMFGWEPSSGPDPLAGRADWETFHLTELPQLMERNFRASDERAIGGLSLGGYGAVMYAARHPGLFRAVASYSGVLDLTARSDMPPQAQAIVESAQQFGAAAGWGKVNPIELVPSLRGTPLYISYGNGVPGPLDPAGTALDELETWVGAGGDDFVAALHAAGIAATVNAYGPGTHSWGYWDRELGASLPSLLAALGEPAASPPGPAPS